MKKLESNILEFTPEKVHVVLNPDGSIYSVLIYVDGEDYVQVEAEVGKVLMSTETSIYCKPSEYVKIGVDI